LHRLPVRRLPLVAGYDGYAPARLLAKRGRNRQLLRTALAAAPNDAYVWYQLGKDHAAHDKHEQAARAVAQADALHDPGVPWRTDLATHHLYALKQTGQHAEALAQADRYLPHCQDSSDFFFALGDALLDGAAENPTAVGDLLPLAQTAWMRCLQIGERADQHGSVAGRGSFLAAHNLAVVHEGLGQAAAAQALRQQFPMPSAPPAVA